MNAFVLSGGGNRGALEAGALVALFERGIRPDILVGTSAGAVNAAALALNPTLEGAQQVAAMWKTMKQSDIFPGNWLTFAWRFLTGADSLSPNDNIRKLIERQLPPGVRTFGDIQGVKLYTTTANINTAEIFVYGDDPSALLVDAVMSSAAPPLALPPIVIDGYQYVDGAVCADVPISIAAQKGATDIYAVNVGTGALPRKNIHGIVNLVQRSIAVTVYQQLLNDLDDVWQNPSIRLHYVPMQTYPEIADFDHAPLFIDEGYRIMKAYLDGQPPDAVVVPLEATPPPGAVKWVRSRRWK
ncbi:MAG: patatin-like phospholipase family protein [Chloroflexi bacterium]|nr:patatin-like phospholipase family protein [Chloroflexota bacterium]